MTRAFVGVLIPCALLLASCPAEDAADRDPAVDPALADPPPDDTVRRNLAVCLQSAPFVAAGRIPVQRAGGGGAHQVSGMRWARHEGCERVVIHVASEDGDPATGPGAVTAEVLRDLGVVRVSLRDVPWVAPEATDTTFGGAMAVSAFAVFSPDGRWVFVDLHLGDAAEAHVATLTGPGRVVVDLRPGGPALGAPPVTSRRVVVLAPRPGPASYPITILGYARTFEANVVARLLRGGEEVHEAFTTATAWVDAWGHYAMTIQDGPAGPVVLHVGEYSAKDGSWEGVEVELVMR